MNDNIKTQIISDAPVQICPICDIEGCRHIREVEQLRADKAGLLFDLNKTRAEVRLLKGTME